MVMKLGLNKFSRRSSAEKGDWTRFNRGDTKAIDASGADMSTSDESGLDSMEIMQDNNTNFPLRITEYIHHDHCALIVDGDTKHATGEDTHIWDSMVEFEKAEFEQTSREVNIYEQALTRSSRMLQIATEVQTMVNAKTSVDCQLDDIVLTMNRDNIHNELSYLCRPMVGKWETTLDNSDPLDPLFKNFGIGYVKRFVVDKLALQVEMGFTQDKGHFQMDLAIPFGNRRMQWDLRGNSVTDNDPDCGLWEGHVDLIKFDIHEICPKTSNASTIMQQLIDELPAGHSGHIYAPCQIRSHATIGVVHETRFSVPSKKYGKLLFLKYVLYPKKQSTPIVVMRCCKPLGKDIE